MRNVKKDNVLEKHYTTPELMIEMKKLVDKYYVTPTEFLENSAGTGVLINFLKNEYKDIPIKAYDIFNDKNRNDIIETDYLKEKIDYKKGRVAFINPPFRNGLKFIYKALEECDYCVAILSQNSLLNIDYDKYYPDEIQLWRNYDFGTCKVSIILVALRMKKDGDVYEMF